MGEKRQALLSALTMSLALAVSTPLHAQVKTTPAQAGQAPLDPGKFGGTALFRDRILNADGSINWDQRAFIARNYNKPAILDYRLGPSWAELNPNSTETFPTVFQPDSLGLWKGGTSAALADQFCQTSDKLPRSEQEEARIYDEGGGWQMAGQLLFMPDKDAPADFKAGSANMRAFDGAQAAQYQRNANGSFKLDANGNRILDRIGLCMRMRAEWYPDWWNRNNISVPTTPAVNRLLQAFPNLPLPAVATARGQVQSSLTGFLAFQNGVIAWAGTGNDQYCNGFGTGTTCESWVKLPSGKVPTAMALSAMNEFLFVTVWDVQRRLGQLAVISVGADDPSNIGNQDAKRYGWGVQSWPGIRALKILGYVDLPMVAPTSVDVALSTGTHKFRGYDFWRGPELLTQEGRDEWNARSGLPLGSFLPIETHWKLLAGAGYAVVASRSENKVALVDLKPLLSYYRKMYLTTQANWDQTANSNQGPGARQWPYSFGFRPEQRPVVLGTLNITQPTAVFARQLRTGTNTLSGWISNNWNELSERVTIASMDGTIRQYNVRSLIDPPSTPTMPTQPIRTWQAGVNPTQVTAPIANVIRSDDLYVVSRGTRQIFHFNYDGKLHNILRDSRLKDPVYVTIGGQGAGYGGRGQDLTLNTTAMTVLDYNGKTVHDYGVYTDNYPAQYVPGRLDGWFVEQWPFLGPDGRTIQPFQYGYGNPLPGKPFMFSFDEVI